MNTGFDEDARASQAKFVRAVFMGSGFVLAGAPE